MNIKILVRKGVSEALELLAEAEKNSALADELREKTGISRKKLALLADEGLLEKSDETVLVRTAPIKRRIATYSLSDKGKRLLEICENISDEEAKDFLRVPPHQLDVLRFLSKEGPKRARDILDTPSDKLQRIVKKGVLDKKVEEVEETRQVFRLKRTYTLTGKGTKICKALQTIKSL